MKTKDRIILAAQQILATGGLGALSFDAIARALGVSKQAVLYWFPSKPDLLAELFVGWLQAEADAAEAALADCAAGPPAIAAFVRTIAAFHLGNLDRFRLMYLVPQTLGTGPQDPGDRRVLPQIHATTGRLYAALASRLLAPPAEARQQAVAIHAAVLGLVLMAGLADSIGDPLKHPSDALVSALIVRLAGQAA